MTGNTVAYKTSVVDGICRYPRRGTVANIAFRVCRDMSGGFARCNDVVVTTGARTQYHTMIDAQRCRRKRCWTWRMACFAGVGTIDMRR